METERKNVLLGPCASQDAVIAVISQYVKQNGVHPVDLAIWSTLFQTYQ